MIDLFIQKKLNAPHGNMLLDIQCQIESKQLVTLYGKSGVGKTSTLRILAGLLQPDFGKISIDGNVLLDTAHKINLPPQKRKIGLVFQDYALFPNMTIFDNLSFALQKNQDKKILDELIEIMELGDLKNQKPYKLSGGQKQRTALARALVQKPKLLLLDEPLSALDVEMRSKLQKYLLQVHREFGLTTILISHDISEILKLSDQILVLENGKLIQQASPLDYFFPKRENENAAIQLTGEIVKIETNDSENILFVLVGKDLVNIVLGKNEMENFTIGDRVIINWNGNQSKVRKL